MVDVAKLPTYSDAYLKEIRGQVVAEIDANRMEVARGKIGRPRVLANKEIAKGREVRDTIDALLAERAKGKPVEVAKPAPKPKPKSGRRRTTTVKEPPKPMRPDFESHDPDAD